MTAMSRRPVGQVPLRWLLGPRGRTGIKTDNGGKKGGKEGRRENGGVGGGVEKE